MNKYILDKLTTSKENNYTQSTLTILPHQLATLDYLIKRILGENDSVLIFHEMGSGKTIIALLFALVASITKDIFILLPSNNIHDIWKNKLQYTRSIMGNVGNIDKIKFMSVTGFISKKTINGVFEMSKCMDCKNSIFIIDEAHNLFGNSTGQNIQDLKTHFGIPFLLLSGSPINNTPKTLTFIIQLLSGQELSLSDIVQQKTKIIHVVLKSEGEETLRTLLKKRISYYQNDQTSIPVPEYVGEKIYKYPAILCPMEPLQEKDYNMTRERVQNEMFGRIVTNVSLCAIGRYYLYQDVNVTSQLESEKLMPGLEIVNGMLEGEELVNLNMSSKLKYFVHEIKKNITNPQKQLIYFSNATYGTFIIKSVMLANGISEYEGTTARDPLCFECERRKTCKKCIYINFVILTSKVNENISPTLKVFNSKKNKKGHFISLLFASYVLSQSYTLTEVKCVWFFTIPDTYSQYTQIVGRAIRKFSYENVDEKVYIKILLTVPKNYRYVEIGDNISDEELEDLPFDIKKKYYLELKSNESTKIYNLFKEISEFTQDSVSPELWEAMLLELLRLFFVDTVRIKLNNTKFQKHVQFLGPTPTEHQELLQSVLQKHPQVINKHFGNCLLYYLESNQEVVCVPIILSLPDHYYRIIPQFKEDNTLNYMNKTHNIFMVLNSPHEKLLNYVNSTGNVINSNVISLTKNDLLFICDQLKIQIGHKARRLEILEYIEKRLHELQKENPKSLYIDKRYS